MGIGNAARKLLTTPDVETARSAENIRRVTGQLDIGSGAPGAVRRNLATSPNSAGADKTMPLGIARELIRTPEGREQLRGMVGSMSPKAQENFFQSIARETRDPQSPAKNISLTPEGQMILDIAFKPDFEPDPAALARVGDPADGVRLDEIELGDDASPKAPPAAPKPPEGVRKGDLKDVPSFRSSEKIKPNKDGTHAITHSDVSLDRETKNAIERVKEGKPVAPIYDDPRNTPPGKIPGNALSAGTRGPKQRFTESLNRVAELSVPGSNGRGIMDELDDMDDMGGNRSAFAPISNSDIQGSRIATVKASDYGDLMNLARAVGIKDPNTFSSPEEFARALVSKAHQGGYDVTPITASQRKQVEDTVIGMVGDNTVPSEADAQTVARVFEPDAVRAARAAERAVVQEQVIASLARKADQLMGHNGWGENYKPRSQSAGVDGPSTETGPRAGMTQDPTQVPGDSNVRVDADPIPPKVRMDTRRQPMEIGEDVDVEDLTDLDDRKRFVTGDPNAKAVEGGDLTREQVTGPEAREVNGETYYEQPGDLRTGFQEDARTTKYRSPPNADKPYADPDAQYADYNAENRSPDDLAARGNEYNLATSRGVRGLNRERSSDLRRQIGELLNSDGDLTPEQLTQLADLQQRLRGAQSLDSMSGIRSMLSDDMFEAAHSLRESVDSDFSDYIDSITNWQRTAPEAYDPLKGQIDNVVKELRTLDGGGTPEQRARLAAALEETGRNAAAYPGIRQRLTGPDSSVDSAGNASDLGAVDSKLTAAATDIGPADRRIEGVDQQYWDEVNQRWVDEDPWGLDGSPRRAGGGGGGDPPGPPPKNLPGPDEPSNRGLTTTAKQADGQNPRKPWSRGGKIAATLTGLGAVGAGYMMLNKAGSPDAPEFDYYDGKRPQTPEEMGFSADAMDSTFPLKTGGAIRPMLASPEDRIRAVQASLRGMRLNADTQHMQNWTH